MNSKILIVLLLSITLIMCSVVSAENLTTTDSGMVNGGVYSHSVQDPAYSAQNSGDNEATVKFNITKEERTYNNDNTATSTNEEKHVKNVSDAVLSTMIYVQGIDTDKSSYVNISLDGDNDGTYETILENNRLLNISSSRDGEVHKVNENITRVYSDYLLNYDISDYIKSDSVNVNVHATSAAGSSDSKIKYVAVIAAYTVENSDKEYYYSINTGHSWNAVGDTLTTQFNLPANATSNITHAVLTQVATSSSKATTKFNDKEYQTVTPSNYYSENTWDVTEDVLSDNTLVNIVENGSYKTTIATLTITKEASNEESLNVTNVKVTSNSNNFLAKQINNISVSITSSENHSPVNVTLKIDDDEITQELSNPSTSNTLVYPYQPSTDGIKNVEIIITKQDGTTETAYTSTLTAYYNGYSSKSYNNEENFTTSRQYTGKYTPIIIPTTAYSSGGFNNFTKTINFADYNINDTSKIKEVLYYQGYNWDNGYIVNELQLSINNQTLNPIANYNDTKGFGGWDYPSGLIVYNATDKFNYADQATLSFTRDIKTQVALYGGYFLVIYENTTEDTNIQINEFTDLLAAGGSCYGANNTTALIYSTNNITTENLKTSTIYVISASANEQGGSMIYVNDKSYTSMNTNYNSTSQVSFTEINPDNLIEGQNTIALQSLADNLAAYTTILYTTYEIPADLVVDDVNVTSNSANLLVAQDNTVSINISNPGSGINATLNIDVDGTVSTTELTDFTGTQTIDVVYVPETDGEKSITVTATYPDETSETLYEGTITAYYNGYMGKSFTNGENFTTKRTYEGTNTLIISPLEFYKSTKWTEFTEQYDAATNGITDQDKIVEVLYYQGYNWNNNELAINVNINDIDTTQIANYYDSKGFAKYNYPSGVLVYNATSAFKANQINNIKITPLENNGNALYGGYLIIIYANNIDNTSIIINEGADLLNPESSGFGANSSNTVAYSNYNNIISSPNTTLYTITAAAEKTDGSIILVNNKEYTSLADNYNEVTKISIVTVDVDNIVDGENLVTLQSTNDNLFTMGTILVVSTINEPELVIDPITADAGDTINLTAKIMINNNIFDVDSGKVVFKINGKTIKDENGKIIYAKVTDGIATIEYTIPDSFAGKSINLTAVYSGSQKVKSLRQTQEVTINKKTPTLTITPFEESVKIGSTITLKAKVTCDDSSVTSGKVVFKINGKTIKDEKGKIIYATVDENGDFTLNYTVNLKEKDYTLEAIFTATGYDRLTSNTTLKVVK